MSETTVTGYSDERGEWHYPVSHVPAKQFRDVRRELGEASELLSAIDMLSPPNLATFLRRLDGIFAQIDQRLGELEKRADEAQLPEGKIADDESEKYFTLPAVWGWDT